MTLGGFQSLSLVDYPGKICSIVFTQGCLFRCPYCHNPELVEQRATSALPMEQVLALLAERASFVDGICITGGEPTLQQDLPEFIERVRSLGLLVKLDTNGSNPRMVSRLVGANLVDYVAMDLKHTWEKYSRVARTPNETAVENCRTTFSLIQDSQVDHEFRTTVFPEEHTLQDFETMAGYLRPGEKYFIQDIQFAKNLDPGINRVKRLNVPAIVGHLRSLFPQLSIAER
ncbi:MAG: anaerobic ribonucleoside-triphosphate reductase activating protein [Parcubacteria group bacterium]|nr:anaerobic ribonucleoside-triphosphate reductase activating protein [Parcubacteria group bacterium]